MWWIGTIVASNKISALGNGLYNVSLTPIVIAPGEDAILLKVKISAPCHDVKHFETFIAVDPETVDKSPISTQPKKRNGNGNSPPPPPPPW